ncbi:MAG: nitrilase-related carbon-nitrogen hydrolase [Planctomycetota bacterium]
MRAHLLQLDLIWEDRAANHELVERTLDTVELDRGDLVVLPELFDSGFSLNTDSTADREGTTLRFLVDLADDLGVVIQGSRTVRDCHCNKATNRATIVGPGQRLLCDYSKVHPFGYGREPEAFEGGRSVETYEWSSGNGRLTVCPAVCYDLRFPELFRRGVSLGAECFALGANWPSARARHWRSLLIARAIENQAFVLGVNRCGSDPHLGYAGGSLAIGPKGDVLGELGQDPGVLSIELDPESVRAWRTEFPALEDRVL